MKRLIYIAMAAAVISITSCRDDNNVDNNHEAPSVDTTQVDQQDDTTAYTQVTGVVVDGARRNIDLEVDGEVINFELPSSVETSWEIGDTLVVRYVPSEYGDSVIEVLDESYDAEF